MPPRWPITLPQELLQSGFDYSPTSRVDVFRTERDERRRQKYLAPLNRVQGAVPMTDLEWAELRRFWLDDIQSGTAQFFFPTPLEDASEVIVTFERAPTRTRSGNHWLVQLPLRIETREQVLAQAPALRVRLGLLEPAGIGIGQGYSLPIGLGLGGPFLIVNGQAQQIQIALELAETTGHIEATVDRLAFNLALGRPLSQGDLETLGLSLNLGLATPSLEYEHGRPLSIAMALALARPLDRVDALPDALGAGLALGDFALEFENVLPEVLRAALALGRPLDRVHAQQAPLGIGLSFGSPPLEYHRARPFNLRPALGLGQPLIPVTGISNAILAKLSLAGFGLEFQNVRPEELQAALGLAQPLDRANAIPHAMPVGLIPGMPNLEYEHARPGSLAAALSLPSPLVPVSGLPAAVLAKLALGEANLEYRHARPLTITPALAMAQPIADESLVPRGLGIGLAPARPLSPTRGFATALSIRLSIAAEVDVQAEPQALGIDLALAMPEGIEPERRGIIWPGDIRLQWPGDQALDWPGVA